MDIDINFRAKYLNYHDIVNNITRLNNYLNIHIFHFFKNNELSYIKKMVYNYNTYNYYRISKSVLNSFYDNNYKIFYRHYVILLTNTYVSQNQRLIYINTYQDNSFRNFIIGGYYKFLSREYIEFNNQHIYYQMTVRDFYYCNYYISKQEMNDIQEQLKTCSKSIQLLYTL